MKIFNTDSLFNLVLVLSVDVCIIGLFLTYLLGFSSKDGLFPFLQRSASVGDVLVIVVAALFSFDAVATTRAEVMDKNNEIRFNNLENKIIDKLKEMK